MSLYKSSARPRLEVFFEVESFLILHTKFIVELRKNQLNLISLFDISL